MSERTIADAFDRWLREQGLVFRRDRTDKATTCVRGWPDFEIIEKGRVCLLELKTDKGRLSRDQTNLHKRFKDSGTTVYICRDIESACLVVQLWRSTLPKAPAEARKDDGLRRHMNAVWRDTGNGILQHVRAIQPGDENIPTLK